jgi:purine catabolism regulator
VSGEHRSTDLTPPGLETGELTVRDLLEVEPFGLELVAGSDEHLSCTVRGAHSTEVAQPTRWLDHDWILLCAATAIPTLGDAQRRLISELRGGRVAALGLGLGELNASVPEELAEEARRVGFPVFVVPPPTPFREIIAFVLRNLMSEEVRAFSRMTAIQRVLMDAIGEDEPIQSAVERLAQLVNVKVGLLLPTGAWEVTTADLPAREILSAVSGRHALTRSFTASDLEGHALAVRDPGGGESSWLVLAVREGAHMHPLALAAGNATVPLIAAMRRLGRVQRDVDNAVRSAALEALILAQTPGDARTPAAQAAAWGLEVAAGVVAVVVEDPTARVDPGNMRERALAGRDWWAPALMATVHGTQLRVLVPAPVSGDAIRANLMGPHAALRAGVGRIVTDPLDVSRSFAEAELSLQASVAGDRAIGRFDDLDLGTVLLHELPLERLRPKVTAWLGPLRENPRVYETLVAYLDHDLDVGQTALALHLHPNSVRYRLGRAEELIGKPIRSPTTLIALQVALVSGLGALDDDERP